MYIYVRASMLKDLYRRLRAKDRKIEYLNLVIEHLRHKEPEEEELCSSFSSAGKSKDDFLDKIFGNMGF